VVAVSSLRRDRAALVHKAPLIARDAGDITYDRLPECQLTPEGGGKAGLDLPDVSDGLQGLHPLAHYGKHCVDRGVDIRIIAEALGHESLESIKIFTQVSFERTRRIAELFALPGS
jgi:hypothetical protein